MSENPKQLALWSCLRYMPAKFTSIIKSQFHNNFENTRNNPSLNLVT